MGRGLGEKADIYGVITKDELLQIHLALYFIKELLQKLNINHKLFKYYDENCIKPYDILAMKDEHRRSVIVLCQAIVSILNGGVDNAKRSEETDCIYQERLS